MIVQNSPPFLSSASWSMDAISFAITETKSLSDHSRTSTDTEIVTIQGRDFLIQPKVFHPGIFFSSNWFAAEVSKLVTGESNFCEVGCGSGVVSITATTDNPTLHTTAVDINEYAVANTIDNIKKYSLQERMVCIQSNVLDAIEPHNQFDSIFWAMPFGYLEPETEVDIIDLQTFDPGYKSIERFFETAKKYLTKNGRLLIGFSEEIGTRELLNELIEKYKYSINKIKQEEGMEKSAVTMEILEAKPL